MYTINEDKLVYKMNCLYLVFKCEIELFEVSFVLKWYTKWKFNANIFKI